MARPIYESKMMESIDTKEYLSKARKSFLAMLDRYNSITIVTHIYPDADTIGTALGLADLLKKSGKRVEVVNVSNDIPRNLDFLKGYEKIKKRAEYKGSLMISCDCGDIDRLGVDIEGRELINIDHHLGNTMYGDLNIVLPNAASASEVAYRLIKPIIKMSKEAAEAFYTALMVDTRNFTTNSVTAETFELALDLIRDGAEPSYIAKMVLLRNSLSSLRLLSIALSDLELFAEAKVAVIRIRKRDLDRSGAKSSDIDGIVDYARSLATVEVAVLCVEYDDSIKVSLRSKNIDISNIATSFGGGGHINAAGFTIREVDIDEVCKRVIDTIKHNLKIEGILRR